MLYVGMCMWVCLYAGLFFLFVLEMGFLRELHVSLI
jgi:hypothetical protein